MSKLTNIAQINLLFLLNWIDFYFCYCSETLVERWKIDNCCFSRLAVHKNRSQQESLVIKQNLCFFTVKFITRFKGKFFINRCKAQQTVQADISAEISSPWMKVSCMKSFSPSIMRSIQKKSIISRSKQNCKWIEIPADFHWQRKSNRCE